MLSQPEPACLVIADISGYTGFLAGAELDHAQDILADLIGTVVGALRPTFKLAKLEGDAAFVYSITEAVDGAQLQDVIERCYFAFRRRLRDIRQASSCECNACILVPNLDLKVVAHHGQVIRQRIAVAGGARRERRDRRPPAAEEPRPRGRDRDRRLRDVHRRLCRGDGPRRPGRGGPPRASRGLRGRRRGRGLAARPAGGLGGRARPGPRRRRAERTRRGSTPRSSTPRRRSSGTT